MGQPAEVPQTRHAARCLVIEDSEFDQRRMRRVLGRSIRLEIHVAENLAEARQMIDTSGFSLIIADNALPDGLGIDFVREIRERSHLARTPILMVSDHPTPFMYDKAMSARVTAVLAKDDFQPSHVREALRHGRPTARPTH